MRETVWVLAVSAAVALGPGAAVLALLRVRGWLLLSLAPVVSTGCIAVLAVPAEAIGLHWSPVVALAGIGLLAASAVAVSRLRQRPMVMPGVSWTSRESLMVTGGLVGAAMLMLHTFLSGMGDVGELFWNFDSPFHYGAVQQVVAEQRLTLDNLSQVNNYADESPGFYPPLLYGASSIVASISGANAVAAVNGFALVTFAISLPAGLVGLARALGASARVGLGLALCSPIVEAFPLDALIRGPIFPFVVALALVPAFLALLVVGASARGLDGAVLAALLAGSAAGLFLMHSASPYNVAIFAVPLLIQILPEQPRVGEALGWLLAAGIGALALVSPWLTPALEALESVTGGGLWEPDRSPAQALGNALTSSHVNPYFESAESVFPQWWVTALLLAGVIAATRLRPRFYWLIAAWALATGAFVIAASFDSEVLRSLTSVWYNDSKRIWGVTGLSVIMVIGVGLAGLIELIWFRVAPRSRVVASIGATSLIAALVVVTNGLYAPRMADVSRSYFSLGSQGITEAELRAYEWLAEQPDSNTWIVNEWYDGSAMMLPLEGLRPVWGAYRFTHRDHGLIYDRFNQLETDEEIQRIVSERDIRYIVVGNTYPVSGGGRGPAPGLTGLAELDSVDVVYTSPDTVIYRIRDSYRGSLDGASFTD